jgi:phenylacetate-CoA ligase
MQQVRELVYFAYHRALRHGLPSVYGRIAAEDAARYTPGEVYRRQDEALTRLIQHCRDTVPFYRDRIASAGVPEADPREYLRGLPLLTKADLRHDGAELVTSVPRRGINRVSSGGSTGEPVSLVQDQQHWDWSAAVQMLHTSWTGHRIGGSEVYVWGSERDLLTGTVGVRMAAVNALMRRSYLNAFRMTADDMRGLLRRLDERPPDIIVAYAQSLYEVARFASEEGIAVRPQRAVIVTSETLHGFMRDAIESTFGCRVFNRYGSREVGDIAGECPSHEGLHVFPWTNYVEIVDERGEPVPPGVDGEVVVTCLTNFAMPLVRYRIGDRAALAPDGVCSCGRAGQRLLRVLGHSGETFKSSDGALVDGGYLTGMMYLREWVERFQVVQHDYDVLEFRIVPRAGTKPPERELSEITGKVRRAMGERCDVRFAFVDDIPPLPSGKFTYTISHV